jgi:plasmid stability protein
MAAVTIRSLKDETHRALKARAKANGRSTEAEMRAILEDAVLPRERMRAGTYIRRLVEKYGALDLEIERDKSPARFPDFTAPEFDRPEPE